MHQNCKCTKCKKTLCRHYGSSESQNATPSRIPTLQNKCAGYDSTFTSPSSSASKCGCSRKQSEQKYGPENIKTFNIDIDETIRRIEERRASRGCHCSKKELDTRKITSNVSTKLDKSGCACGQKDVHFSATSIPVSLTIKNPDGQSRKSVCSCMNKDKSIDTFPSTTKVITLPEVKIEICPDKIQTIQIDVKPTDLDTKTSGIITIPVQLRFRRCQEEVAAIEVPRVPREKLLFEACTGREFMENYMEQLIEESETSIKSEEEEEEETEELEKPKTPQKMQSRICNCNDEDPKKTEIIGLKRPPWQEQMEKENYIEPYLVEGYCASTDNVEVQTDLVLGDQLLSDSLNSVPDSTSKPDITKSTVCLCGKQEVKASATIRWDLLFITPPPKKPITFTPKDLLIADYILIKKLFTEPAVPENAPLMIPWTPRPPPEVKKKGLSSCCRGAPEDPPWPEPPEPEPLPELVPLPEKITFVYQSHCPRNEQYLNVLSRAYPREEYTFTPPTSMRKTDFDSKPVIPWKRLEIPRKIKIRKMMKLKIDKERPISVSAPCLCRSKNDSMSSVKDADSKKSGTSNMSVPCPYLSKRNSYPTQFPMKSLGNNQYQTKIIMDKQKSGPVSNPCQMKAKFLASGSNPEGKMFTKVKFKNDANAGSCKSSAQNWKISSELTPVNSKTVTCKYLNASLKESTENSRPSFSLSPSSCAPNTCKYKKPEPCPCPPCQKTAAMYKQDPVIAAFHACEAELKPVREALSTLKQNLKNLNMPELDCIFQNEGDSMSQSRTQCSCNISQQGMSPSRCPCRRNVSRDGSRMQNRMRPSSPGPNQSRCRQPQRTMSPTRNKSPTSSTCAANRSMSPSRNKSPISNTCATNRSRNGTGELNSFGVNMSENPSKLSTKNIFKARNQRFYSTSTYNTFYPDASSPQGYDDQYYSYPQNSTNNLCNACNTPPRNSSSSGSSVPRNNYSVSTVLNVPAKRNKGIQKTGSMYRTNIKKAKCPAQTPTPDCVEQISNNSRSKSSGSGYSGSSATSASYIQPCSAATHPKIAKMAKSDKKRIKSQVSFTSLTESMGPFIEAIKSILMVDESKVNQKGRDMSYDAKVMTKEMRKMRLHMRIRPSRSSKRKK